MGACYLRSIAWAHLEKTCRFGRDATVAMRTPTTIEAKACARCGYLRRVRVQEGNWNDISCERCRKIYERDHDGNES